VFIGEILAYMTQVSDVAPGPLVKIGQRKFELDLERIGDIYEGFFS
jgi:hypothetical protein